MLAQSFCSLMLLLLILSQELCSPTVLIWQIASSFLPNVLQGSLDYPSLILSWGASSLPCKKALFKQKQSGLIHLIKAVSKWICIVQCGLLHSCNISHFSASSVLHLYVGCLVQWPHCNHTTLALCWKKLKRASRIAERSKVEARH